MMRYNVVIVGWWEVGGEGQYLRVSENKPVEQDMLK